MNMDYPEKKLTRVEVRNDGRENARKTVGDDKAYNITATSVSAGAVGQSQLKYETVTLAFGSADTSKTATVTSGDVIIGVYSSAVTGTPAYGELQLSISGTTLTGTRSASPGGVAAITYTVILLKA